MPEALADRKDMLLASIEELISQDKIRRISIESDAEQGLDALIPYAGLLGILADLAGEKYGASSQKMLIPSCSHDKEILASPVGFDKKTFRIHTRWIKMGQNEN